jgi:hypothetical protein
MIHILILIFYIIFSKGKKVIQWLEFPLSTKGFRVLSFIQIFFFFHEQIGFFFLMGNFFKLDVERKKEFFFKEEKKW